jgi:hypothetical protein
MTSESGADAVELIAASTPAHYEQRSAIAMYREIGFRECPAYYEIPQDFRNITVFMELDLRGQRSFSAGSHCW